MIAGIGLRDETVGPTPGTPDLNGPQAAASGLGQGWQGFTAVFLDGSAGDVIDEDEIERLAATTTRQTTIFGDDGCLELLDQAHAGGFITEQERRRRRLIHLAVRRATAA